MADRASQGYLRITDRNGNLVKGESIDDEHLDEIDLTDWNWGVTDPAAKKKKEEATPTANSTGGATARTTGAPARSASSGRQTGDNVEPSEFSFSKKTDRSTVRLISSMDNGEVFPSVRLHLEEEYKASPLPFQMIIEFFDVFFVSQTWNVSTTGKGVDYGEEWTFTYRKIKISYLWRGAPPGWITVEFDRPPDSAGGTSKRVPPTATEQAATKKREEDEMRKRWEKDMERNSRK